MSTDLGRPRLVQLAAGANREHLACEQAYGSAIEHAFRAGELLLEAKAEVAHGEWLPWVEENFVGSYRTCARYMQVAQAEELPRVADMSLRAALHALANPRELDPHPDAPEEVDAEPAAEVEVIDAEPVLDRGALFAALGGEEGIGELEKALGEEDACRDKFPRTGVERTTLRQIREAGRRAERHLRRAARVPNLSDWEVAQELAAAAAEHKEAFELTTELALVLSRRFDEASLRRQADRASS